MVRQHRSSQGYTARHVPNERWKMTESPQMRHGFLTTVEDMNYKGIRSTLFWMHQNVLADMNLLLKESCFHGVGHSPLAGIQ